MWPALRNHWPEYLMEAAGLGLFMVSAGLFGTLLGYPGSPVHQAIDSEQARRGLMGMAMGLTAVVLIYSPWGKQSGAHLNPAVTLTFFRLGKVDPRDAIFYPIAQLIGGLIGVMAVWAVLGRAFSEAPVSCVATMPGRFGVAAAFFAEAVITFILMFVVLTVSNTPRLARYTGLFVGALVALYITYEEPLSGMSMNPARSFASAAPGGLWNGLWIYLVAPPLGMLLAAECYVRFCGARRVRCAKLHHDNDKRCIFCMRSEQANSHRALHETMQSRITAISGVIH